MNFKFNISSVKQLLFSIFIVSLCSCKCELKLPTPQPSAIENHEIIDLSINLLSKVKAKENYQATVDQLSKLKINEIESALNSDRKKMIFWLNVYNAFIQIELEKDSSQYEKREHFFSAHKINVADLKLSFDDIEHIILRGNEFKFGLGHIKNPFTSANLKLLSVKEKDPRLHFALNCGAKSCPPIAIYKPTNYHNLIEKVAKQFLRENCRYYSVEKILEVTPLFSWFRGDFCGKEGAKEYLLHYGIIKDSQGVNLSYSDYDWDLALENYYED